MFVGPTSPYSVISCSLSVLDAKKFTFSRARAKKTLAWQLLCPEKIFLAFPQLFPQEEDSCRAHKKEKISREAAKPPS
jgi:hypothetical protein